MSLFLFPIVFDTLHDVYKLIQRADNETTAPTQRTSFATLERFRRNRTKNSSTISFSHLLRGTSSQAAGATACSNCLAACTHHSQLCDDNTDDNTDDPDHQSFLNLPAIPRGQPQQANNNRQPVSLSRAAESALASPEAAAAASGSSRLTQEALAIHNRATPLINRTIRTGNRTITVGAGLYIHGIGYARPQAPTTDQAADDARWAELVRESHRLAGWTSTANPISNAAPSNGEAMVRDNAGQMQIHDEDETTLEEDIQAELGRVNEGFEYEYVSRGEGYSDESEDETDDDETDSVSEYTVNSVDSMDDLDESDFVISNYNVEENAVGAHSQGTQAAVATAAAGTQATAVQQQPQQGTQRFTFAVAASYRRGGDAAGEQK